MKIALMSLRLVWLISLATGVLLYFKPNALPVNVHMYLGFLIAALMIAVALMSFRAVAGLALATIAVAILLPVVGILQLVHVGRSDLPYIQVTHVVLGVAAIALAEITGKRRRLSIA